MDIKSQVLNWEENKNFLLEKWNYTFSLSLSLICFNLSGENPLNMFRHPGKI